MKLFERVVSRSGELSFDEQVDNGELGNQARYKWIRSYLSDRAPHPAIVDFGCWTGGSLAQMRALEPRELAGLDLPGPWIEAARNNLPQADIVEVSDFSPLPAIFQNRFDVALFLETLEHIPRNTETRTLQTICESLKPGGVIILSTPAAGLAAPLDPAWLLVGHRHYRKATLKRLLAEAGFRPINIGYSGGWAYSIDAIQMYAKKHLMHRVHSASERVAKAMDTGILSTRSAGTATIWAFAVKPAQ